MPLLRTGYFVAEIVTYPYIFFILFRISSNSFLLNRSWIENIRSTAEAAGEATTQQEEVACHVVPTMHSEDSSCCCYG